jgi:hypothetical protein
MATFNFAAKTMNDSNEGLILQAVHARLLVIALPQINAGNVVVRSLPWDTDLQPPYVIVSPAPESAQWDQGTNEKDRIILGSMISIVVANDRNLSTTNMAISLFWRQRVRRGFQNVGKATFNPTLLTGCFHEHTYVESGEKFIDTAKRMNYDAQYLLVRTKIKESRETS